MPSRSKRPTEQRQERAADFERFRHDKPKVLIWDIESTGLNATFGTILCIGWKWLDDPKTNMISILDRKRAKGKIATLDDLPIVKDFAEIFGQCDYHVTWYGDRFDLPMVRTKLIKYGEAPLPPKPSVDLWRPARKLFKSHSNRLNVWEQILGTKHAKTPISFEAWLRAAHGDKLAIAEVEHHCKKDILVLEEAYKKFLPWLDNVPVRSLITGDDHTCPACGSDKIHRRGYKVAATRIYAQYRCMDCGHWCRGREALGTTPLRNTA